MLNYYSYYIRIRLDYITQGQGYNGSCNPHCTDTGDGRTCNAAIERLIHTNHDDIAKANEMHSI